MFWGDRVLVLLRFRSDVPPFTCSTVPRIGNLGRRRVKKLILETSLPTLGSVGIRTSPSQQNQALCQRVPVDETHGLRNIASQFRGPFGHSKPFRRCRLGSDDFQAAADVSGNTVVASFHRSTLRLPDDPGILQNPAFRV